MFKFLKRPLSKSKIIEALYASNEDSQRELLQRTFRYDVWDMVSYSHILNFNFLQAINDNINQSTAKR